MQRDWKHFSWEGWYNPLLRADIQFVWWQIVWEERSIHVWFCTCWHLDNDRFVWNKVEADLIELLRESSQSMINMYFLLPVGGATIKIKNLTAEVFRSGVLSHMWSLDWIRWCGVDWHWFIRSRRRTILCRFTEVPIFNASFRASQGSQYFPYHYNRVAPRPPGISARHPIIFSIVPDYSRSNVRSLFLNTSLFFYSTKRPLLIISTNQHVT